MKKINLKNTPIISGVDALYYFAQSGAYYDDFYQDILNQIEDKKSEFMALNCKKRSKSDTYDTLVRTPMTVSFGQ